MAHKDYVASLGDAPVWTPVNQLQPTFSDDKALVLLQAADMCWPAKRDSFQLTTSPPSYATVSVHDSRLAVDIAL